MSICTVLFMRIEEGISSSLKLYGALGLSLFAHAVLLMGGLALNSNAPLRQPDAIPSEELTVKLVALAPSHPPSSSTSSSMRPVPPVRHAKSPTQANATQIATKLSVDIATKLSVERQHEGASTPANAPIHTAIHIELHDEPPILMNPSRLVTLPSVERTDERTASPVTQVTMSESSELSGTNKPDVLALLDAPRPQYAPEPDYPDEARWEEREGRTVLRFRLQTSGSVGETQVVDSSGHADLDAAALATLRQWRFKPPGDASASAESWYRYAFRFALR